MGAQVFAYNHLLACTVLQSAIKEYYKRIPKFKGSKELAEHDLYAALSLETLLVALKAEDSAEETGRKVRLLLYDGEVGIHTMLVRVLLYRCLTEDAESSDAHIQQRATATRAVIEAGPRAAGGDNQSYSGMDIGSSVGSVNSRGDESTSPEEFRRYHVEVLGAGTACVTGFYAFARMDKDTWTPVFEMDGAWEGVKVVFSIYYAVCTFGEGARARDEPYWYLSILNHPVATGSGSDTGNDTGTGSTPPSPSRDGEAPTPTSSQERDIDFYQAKVNSHEALLLPQSSLVWKACSEGHSQEPTPEVRLMYIDPSSYSSPYDTPPRGRGRGGYGDTPSSSEGQPSPYHYSPSPPSSSHHSRHQQQGQGQGQGGHTAAGGACQGQQYSTHAHATVDGEDDLYGSVSDVSPNISPLESPHPSPERRQRQQEYYSQTGGLSIPTADISVAFGDDGGDYSSGTEGSGVPVPTSTALPSSGGRGRGAAGSHLGSRPRGPEFPNPVIIPNDSSGAEREEGELDEDDEGDSLAGHDTTRGNGSDQDSLESMEGHYSQ
jgi:hypothetical protein